MSRIQEEKEFRFRNKVEQCKIDKDLETIHETGENVIETYNPTHLPLPNKYPESYDSGRKRRDIPKSYNVMTATLREPLEPLEEFNGNISQSHENLSSLRNSVGLSEA